MLKQKYRMWKQTGITCMCIVASPSSPRHHQILEGKMTHCEETYEKLRSTLQLLLGLIQSPFMSIIDFSDFEELDVNTPQSKLPF